MKENALDPETQVRELFRVDPAQRRSCAIIAQDSDGLRKYRAFLSGAWIVRSNGKTREFRPAITFPGY